MKAEFKLTITFLLFVISSLVLYFLIKGESNNSFLWRITFSLFAGGIIGSLLFFLWKSFCCKTAIFRIDVALTIISIIITIVIATLPPRGSNLDEIYRKTKNLNNVEKVFSDSTENKHCYIFMLDKTMNAKYNLPFPQRLTDTYKFFVEKIKKEGYSCFPKKESNISYIDFCRAKLCVDLLELHSKGVSGRFRIYSLDEDTEPLYPEDKEIESLEDITKSIIKLTDTIRVNKDTESDFNDFYDKIKNIVQLNHSRYEYNQYTLYAYSDFVHDKKQTLNYDEYKFQQDTSNIKTNQKILQGQSIVQNLFTVPFNFKSNNPKNNFCAFILDNKMNQVFYENIISIENIDYREDMAMYNKIKYINDFTIYYPVVDNQCIINIQFPNLKFGVRLKEKESLDDNQEIKLNNESLNDSKFIKISNTICSLIFKGSCPEYQKIYLDIASESGTHAIVKLDFIKSYEGIKYLLPISCFLLAFFLVIAILTISRENTRV